MSRRHVPVVVTIFILWWIDSKARAILEVDYPFVGIVVTVVGLYLLGLSIVLGAEVNSEIAVAAEKRGEPDAPDANVATAGSERDTREPGGAGAAKERGAKAEKGAPPKQQIQALIAAIRAGRTSPEDQFKL